MDKLKLLLLTVILCINLPSYSITAEFMEGQFEPVLDIGNVTKIEAWEQPRTQYTPKNLKSEYQIRYSGTDKNGKGAYSYTTHFTDYDTKIQGSYLKDNKYYIQDNTGQSFQTGEHVDLQPINQAITTQQQQLSTINNNMQNIKQGMFDLRDGLHRLNRRMEHGLATVSALTALHPNPRSNEKLEFSMGFGMWQDNPAGAIGIFYHPCDRVQLSVGAAYGGNDSWAGNVGLTFSIGGKRKHAR